MPRSSTVLRTYSFWLLIGSDIPGCSTPGCVPADGLHHDGGDLVRVHVGVGATVLEPALLGLGHAPGDADRCTAVRGRVAERGEVGGLVGPGQAGFDPYPDRKSTRLNSSHANI